VLAAPTYDYHRTAKDQEMARSTITDAKALRGTKRTCQSGECGQRFYDLNRDPITCPICGAAYAIETRSVRDAPLRATPKVVRKPDVAPDEITTKPDTEEDEGLVADVGEAVVPAEDDTFLEEVEEDTPDVTGISDAPIEPDEKL
jgi:uncharacterized protein (TIGR02300 family)